MNTQKTLYRSRKNQMIGGVCAGIAEYLNMDPTVIRLIAVLLAMAAGSGVLAYIVAWIIMPEEPVTTPTHHNKPAHHDAPPAGTDSSTDKSAPVAESTEPTESSGPTDTRHPQEPDHAAKNQLHAARDTSRNDNPQGRSLAGVILIGVGLLFLAQQMFNISIWQYSWPVVIIIVGLFIIVKRG